MLNQPIGSAQCESEYQMQTNKLMTAIAELEERLSVLGNRLEPIRFYGPEKPTPAQAEPPDAPMSSVCDFIRQTTKKVQRLSSVVSDYLSQMQI